jgi:tight adherence protein C
VTSLQAVAVVLTGGLGLVLAVSSRPRFRRPTLAARLHPYLGALGPRRSELLDGGAVTLSAIGRALRPLLDDLAARLHRVVGDRDLEHRLANAGWSSTPAEFRSGQVGSALAGFGVGLALAISIAAAGRAVAVPGALAAACLFGVGGALARERVLDRAVARRRERILMEFPTFADVVCLAVTAGESLYGALDLVASTGRGPLAVELRAALRAARTGEPLADALAQMATRLAVTPVQRFVDAIVAAQHRGVPLADALHTMAREVRETRVRDVITAAGRKQVAMLVPVVGLILPVAIIFAFYPGVVALRMVAR